MKAVLITQPGPAENLQLQDVPQPEPSAHEIRVKVHATAVNRADLLQRRGAYPAPPGTRDDIPGLEFSGEIELTGTKVIGLKPGDRVMGLLPGEGYAEKIITHERMAMPIPANLSFEQAAAIPEVFLTAFDAVTQLNLQMGERILIHAVGSGVGTAALQIATAMGATVFGTAGSREKLLRAKELGLDTGINYKNENFKDAVLTKTESGVDCILDVVGADYWQQNMDCLKPKGRMILVGLLSGAKAEVNLGDILRKRIHVIGTVLRARPIEEKITLTQTFIRQALPMFDSGALKPIVDKIFELEQAAEAHRYMEENKNFGKIILRVS